MPALKSRELMVASLRFKVSLRINFKEMMAMTAIKCAEICRDGHDINFQDQIITFKTRF